MVGVGLACLMGHHAHALPAELRSADPRADMLSLPQSGAYFAILSSESVGTVGNMTTSSSFSHGINFAYNTSPLSCDVLRTGALRCAAVSSVYSSITGRTDNVADDLEQLDLTHSREGVGSGRYGTGDRPLLRASPVPWAAGQGWVPETRADGAGLRYRPSEITIPVAVLDPGGGFDRRVQPGEEDLSPDFSLQASLTRCSTGIDFLDLIMILKMLY